MVDYQKMIYLLLEIQQLEFVTLELNLYLDTHPEDQQALAMYNQRQRELMDCIKKYEQLYGPLLSFGMSPNVGNYWRWVEEPWPWEIKY